MTTWHTDETGMLQYAETSDPRVLVVVEQDTDAQGPDGDAYAPAYWIATRGYGMHVVGNAGSTFDDRDAADSWVAAFDRAPRRRYLDREDFADRFMRVFHDTAVARVSTSDGWILLLNTPAYRVHVGIDNADGTRALNGAGEPIDDSIAYGLEGELETFKAWVDGDVYGVGYAVDAGRVLEDAEIDFSRYEVSLECWGFYGLEYAREAALGMEYGAPELAPLLPIPA